MDSFARKMSVYHEAANGDAGDAYRGLMRYFRDLRNHITSEVPELAPGAIHAGAMDATYIPLLPKRLKQRQLKALVIFFHTTFTFEVWLSGVNKSAQADWWARFRENGFERYELAADPAADYQFVRSVLETEPDFDDLDGLTRSLTDQAQEFVSQIGQFLDDIDA